MTAPEVPHAALIADLRGLADLLTGFGNRATLRRAADALSALGDTVPASTLDKVTASYEEALREARRERDEALRKIKAAPHQFPQCFRFLCNEDDLTYPCTCWKQMP